MDIALEAPAAARLLLRDACGAIHSRLDARLSRVNFSDRAEYADMLARMSGPLSATEGALSAGIAPALFGNWAGRLRAHALRADLAALGASFRQRFAAPIESEAEAFGALYVLEGSRLGGRVLARMADESGDEVVQGATRYFRHGERAGHWRSFLDAMERSSAVRREPERAKHAAIATFEAFEATFA
jgi:heme oxygenase (biliverdin-IX-beta and delta-forming)